MGAKSNTIKDQATREAIRDIEKRLDAIENIRPIKVPDTADDTIRMIIVTLNKITRSFKRN